MTKGKAKVVAVTLFVLAGFFLLSGFVTSCILGGRVYFGVYVVIAIFLAGGGFILLRRNYNPN
jgi:hypothetical protein